MTTLKPLLLVIAVIFSRPVFGQDTDCVDCARQSQCAAKHGTCVAECRARIFGIDPRRTSCISVCDSAVTECTRSVENVCWSTRRCP